MPIVVLPTHLVNKIAAGEVIERPASVVKELVENALDAGAGRIDVAVEDGGRKLVAVSDDGCGMSAEDLALAFWPHATSKLAEEDDLYRIATLGFRGEALASIASVSHAHVRTRRPSDSGGHELAASGETIGQVKPCAAAPGTTVTVRDLFFNTPARRKFLRTAASEFGHVAEQIARLAIPHCRVAFRLSHNGRQVQNLPAVDSTAQRVRDLFGNDLADCLMPVASRGGKARVAGLLGGPAAARSSARWQYLFLNGRYIRDRLLSHAMREAFRGLIDPSRYPVAVLFIDLDPCEVDVNVHPTKIEVRFRDSQFVYGQVLAALKDTLNKADLTAWSTAEPLPSQPAREAPLAAGHFPQASSAGGPVDAAQGSAETAVSASEQQRQQSLRQAIADFFKSAPPPQPRLSFPEPTPLVRPHEGHAFDTKPTRQLDEGESFLGGAAGEPAQQAGRAADSSAQAALQVHNSYIVTGCPEGLLVIDQHALHERILYNELRSRLGQGKLTGQHLLIPQTLSVTAAELATLQAQQQMLARLGVEVVPFGPDTVAVQQFPSLLAERGTCPREFLRDLLDLLIDGRQTQADDLLEGVLQLLSCKAAVKAGQALGAAEIQDLLSRGQAAEGAAFCPHGRPTTLRLTLKDLQRQFKRT